MWVQAVLSEGLVGLPPIECHFVNGLIIAMVEASPFMSVLTIGADERTALKLHQILHAFKASLTKDFWDDI